VHVQFVQAGLPGAFRQAVLFIAWIGRYGMTGCSSTFFTRSRRHTKMNSLCTPRTDSMTD